MPTIKPMVSATTLNTVTAAAIFAWMLPESPFGSWGRRGSCRRWDGPSFRLQTVAPGEFRPEASEAPAVAVLRGGFEI